MKKDILLIIDMNKGFCETGNLANEKLKEIVPNILSLYEKKKDKAKVYAILDDHHDNSAEFKTFPIHCANSVECEIIEELSNIEYDGQLFKNSTNGMVNMLVRDVQSLKNSLLAEDVENIYLVGVLTSFCVMQFATTLKCVLNELDLDKNVVVVSDACADNNQDDHLFALEYMRKNGIEVKITNEL